MANDEKAPVKKKAFLIALAVIVLALIVLSSLIQPPPPREIFEKMMGFQLPKTAQFVRYVYNRVTQEAAFDVRLSPAEYDAVKEDLEALCENGMTHTENESPGDDLDVVSRSLVLMPGGRYFPRRFWFVGKSIPFMDVDVLREKQSGDYRLQVNWFR